ncbi:PQ loop repeat-domain-containing protein [Pyronema omphalodes]|nr:PQ loop repeat-domain-containing protein [Pyronema omphalodes]
MGMHAQTSTPLAATILGLIGTIFWCIQLIPQIWRNWRTKTTTGLPASMMLLWAISGIPFGVYAILQNFNLPLQIQPQVFMVLSMVTFAQCLLYSNRFSAIISSLLSLALLLAFAGIEVALIFTLRPLYHAGNISPVFAIGIIAAILLAAGLLPPYKEVWLRGGMVAGISFVFLGIDWCGAFFSLMSLVAQETFDEMAGGMYCVVLALESGLFLCHGIWWLVRGRKMSKEEIERLERLEKEDVNDSSSTGEEDLEAGEGDGEKEREVEKEAEDAKDAEQEKERERDLEAGRQMV